MEDKYKRMNEYTKEEQLRMLDLICAKIYIARNISMDHQSILDEFSKIDKLYANPPEDKLAERFTRCDEGYQGHYVLSLKGEFHNLQNGSGGDECIVQQWTGLKDKNGVEIYEGDFIRFEKQEGVWPDQIRTHEVQFPFICGNAHLGEVIGNIFENSELLES